MVKDISTCSALMATVSSSAGSTVANSVGSYSLTGLAPNTYSVTAKYSTYTPASKSIAVGPGMAASGKIFLGTASGQINGAVHDASGNAVSAAAVHLTGSASASGADETITTGSTGAYASGLIPAATYQVTASASGYNPSTTTVSLASGATLTQNFVLTSSSSPPPPPPPPPSNNPGTLTGHVLKDDTTVPLAGAKVAYSGGSTLTNSSGVYTLSNVPAGSAVTATASDAGYANSSKSTAVTSSATSTVNFALTPSCIASTTNPSVTLCEPTANSTVLNSVHIVAKTTDSHTVTYTQVWVDGVKKYQVQANSLNTHVSMTTGVTHRVTVQALDNASQIFKQTVYVTVH
ncbi:MAG TPA: carboxypeptidase regulatory-like domain-containing protein [Terriglobales bacterium]|nr:carboxypeptidase regulatory-like domain-containing protein [Terriglobales bacterium]